MCERVRERVCEIVRERVCERVREKGLKSKKVTVKAKVKCKRDPKAQFESCSILTMSSRFNPEIQLL